MPGEHAVLSPSSSGRWISCPASVRASRQIPPGKESTYAHEGTVAHALGELKARFAFGKILEVDYGKALVEWEDWAVGTGITTEQIGDMHQHIKGYVELLQERVAEFPHSELFLEQRVYPGVPECWGTSDAIIISPQHVEAIDLKYGQGVRVDAPDNSQLRLYALGALEIAEMIGEVKWVRSTVFQPRKNHTSTEELTPAEIREWRDTVVIPAAEQALSGEGAFGPSDSACRWCPAAGSCRARYEKMIAEDFGSDPDLLSAQELGDLLPRMKGIRDWVSAVETSALDRVYSQGEHIPGYKVVSSGGKRMITDHTATIQHLIDEGFPAEQVARFSLKGLGELERIVGGREEFDRIVGPYVDKTNGKPSLVGEEDRRPAIDPAGEAVRDFSGIE